MTLLIKNVYVSGDAASSEEKVDIFISGNRISAIGEFPEKAASRVIEGKGVRVMPGFIDIASDSYYTFESIAKEIQERALQGGVTTMIGGHCGTSLAPYVGEESQTSSNVDWHTTSEFLSHVERHPKGVHFGTFVGYRTLLHGVKGRKKELGAFLDKALLEGAFGLSQGMRERVPPDELDVLCSLLAKRGAIYAPRLWSRGEELQKTVKEILRVSEKHKVKTLITHFLPEKGWEDKWKKALDEIGKSEYVYAAVQPLGREAVPLRHFLPEKFQGVQWEKIEQQLSDKEGRKEILGEMRKVEPSMWSITSAPEHASFVGRTLSKVMEGHELQDAREGLLAVLEATRLRGIAEYEDVSPSLVRETFSHPRVLVASHGVIGSFQAFLDAGGAIEKLTEAPAKVLGLEKRGRVEEGYVADLIGMDGKEVQFVVVGGKIAMRGGKSSGVVTGGAIFHTTI